jgi:hypothetical protein
MIDKRLEDLSSRNQIVGTGKGLTSIWWKPASGK